MNIKKTTLLEIQNYFMNIQCVFKRYIALK